MSMLVFQSDRFRPYLPDDCQVNPNVLGFELADWLSRDMITLNKPTHYEVRRRDRGSAACWRGSCSSVPC